MISSGTSRPWACLATLFLLTSACSDGSPAGVGNAPAGGDVQVTNDSAPIPVDTGAAPEVTPDTGAELPPPADGKLGAECNENADCDSGYCIKNPDGGYVCTETCIEDCPAGWLCKGVAHSEPDVTFVCVPELSVLCEPCTNDSDCGGPKHRCLQVGTGEGLTQSCGRACEESADCPSGYQCSAATTWNGETTQQCVPSTGSCICDSALDETTRPCAAENDFGTCYGEEACAGPEGWSGCTAQVPSAEECDGIDNDCDGDFDEGFAPSPCTINNEYGTCYGVRSCEGSGGLICDALVPAEDVCDGVDNNCDGYTDEGAPDIDGDGEADCVDPDNDNDGTPDDEDNCPEIANSDQTDSDKDGIGDVCDDDDDGDGIPDDEDNCPEDSDEEQIDTDNDGIGDVCDQDDDGDGVPDELDCAPLDPAINAGQPELCNGIDDNCNGLTDEGFVDTDADGEADCVDPDNDGDNSPDDEDCQPNDPNVGPNAAELCDGIDNDCDLLVDEDFEDLDGNGILDCIETDTDGDEDPDGTDCAPYNKNIHHGADEVCDGIDNDCDGLTDEDFLDAENDGLADCVDTDDDNDGDPDESDCAPFDPQVSSLSLEICDHKDNNCNNVVDEGFPDTDNDSSANCVDDDDDGDTVPDESDVCPLTPDPDQKDTDNDSAGDVCDEDDDGDGVHDNADNCPTIANSNQTDSDNDGLGNACDNDNDNDGSLNDDDCAPLDPKTHPDAEELCDGIDNNCDGNKDNEFPDSDGDGFSDCVDPDDDNDGDPDGSDCEPLDPAIHANAAELCDGIDNNCQFGTDEGYPDQDGDGKADCVDEDSDGDGIPNVEDNCPAVPNPDQDDSDGDGVGDLCDPVVSGPLHHIIIRNGPNGIGDAVGALTITVETAPLPLYAAGYDSEDVYIGDMPVLWDATGSLETIPAGPSSTVVFAPMMPGTAGTIRAVPTDANIISGETGLIQVVAPPPGEPDPITSTITADKFVLIAGSGETAQITVTLKDKWGSTITAPNEVEVLASAGALQGNVSNLNNGTYEQAIQASDEAAVAVVSATINGQLMASSITISMLEVVTPEGTINCDNIAEFEGKHLLVDNTTLVIQSKDCAPMSFGHVFVRNGGLVTTSVPAGDSVDWIDIQVESLLLDADSSIDVSCRGFAARRWINAEPWSTSTVSGGSHGGNGAIGNQNGSNQTDPNLSYGNFREPRHPGAGGGAGAGGGLVRIATGPNGSLALHGSIQANGCNNTSGAGAGGAIFLQSPFIGGQGSLSANGGNGGSQGCGFACTIHGGAGGGGRIALVGTDTLSESFSSPKMFQSITARSGTNGPTAAGAGTIFIRKNSATHGDLIISNQGVPTAPDSTRLPSVGIGQMTALTDTELTDLDQALVPGLLVGSQLNPNRTQGSAETLTDDVFFNVVGNTETQLFVGGGLLAVASAGDTYGGVVVLDNLEIREGASVHMDGDLMVWEGDLASGDKETFRIQASLKVSKLDLAAVEHIQITGGSLQAESLVGAGSIAFPFDLNIVNGHLSLPDLSASFLDTSQAVLDVGTADIAIQAVLSDSTTMTVSNNEVQVGGELLLKGASVLHQKASTTDVERRLHIIAQNITIEDTSRIHANEAGFPAGLGADGTTATGTGDWAGGSHGGLGGKTSSGTDAADVYGNLHFPDRSGGGAHDVSSGGGVVVLSVANALVVHGQVQANGQSHSHGGGAGGTIRIHTKYLTGNGLIQAHGGNGGTFGCGFACTRYTGGGGGGRIAILDATSLQDSFSSESILHTVTAIGGTGPQGGNAGAGTVFTRANAAAHGNLFIYNGTHVAPPGSTPLPTLPSGASVELSAASLTLAGSMSPDQFVGYWINPNVAQGGPSLTDDEIFQIIHNAETHLAVTPGSDLTAVAQVGDTFRSIFVFEKLSIGPNASVETAGDILVYNGDSLPTTGSQPATFDLWGELFVNRLDLNAVDRIHLMDTGGTLRAGLQAELLIGADNDAFPFHLDLENSWLTIPLVAAQSLTSSHAQIQSARGVIEESATLGDASTWTLSANELSIGTKLDIVSGSTLTHVASSSDTVHRLDITANSVLIGENSSINVDGRGYPASVSPGSIADAGNTGYSGGSHGGRGANGTDGNTPLRAYGVLEKPVHAGSGGAGGAGGGIVQIHATTSVSVNGDIRANGLSVPQGGGAGGSIWIQAPLLAGTGTIQAKGGSGSYFDCGFGCSHNGGSGGGGRISVDGLVNMAGSFGPANAHTGFAAFGGAGPRPAGAGTVFFRTVAQTYGTLVVDNNNVQTDKASTPLVTVPEGVVVSNLGDVITGSSALIAARYEGTFLNPNVNQGTPGLADDVRLQIVSNDESSLTVLTPAGVNLSELASPGDTYRSLFVFDHLTVRGEANLHTAGDILVLSGDLASTDATTFSLEGHITANRLDLNQTQTLESSGTGVGLALEQLIGVNDPGYPFSLSLTGGTLVLPDLVAQSLITDNTDLTVGTLTVQENLTLTENSTLTVTQDLVTVGGLFEVETGSLITHPKSTADAVRRLSIVATALIVHADARIDVSEAGFPTHTPSTIGSAGASHGGLGRFSSQGSQPGPVYGDVTYPTFPGGGGAAGYGGGVVLIESPGTVVINGEITANGQAASKGPGAGGSILISAPQIGGIGQLEARGGNGGHANCGFGCSYSSGGGGGGRIALLDYTLLSGAFAYGANASNLDARGGTQGQGAGGAGTIYARGKDVLHGDLVIDNADQNGAETPLTAVPSGVIHAVDAHSVTSFGAFVDNAYVGCWVRVDSNVLPTESTGETAATLLDDDVYPVLANTEHKLTVDNLGAPLNEAAAVGAPFVGILLLERLQVRGSAHVTTTGDLVIKSGDFGTPELEFEVEAGASLNVGGILELPDSVLPTGDITYGQCYTDYANDFNCGP